MKFCYIDESGTGDEPFAVMVGIIVDSHRMHITKVDWHILLNELSRITGKTICEIHTRDFYAGNGPWRGIDGAMRAQIIDVIYNWFAERKHHLVFSVVDKNKFHSDFRNEKYFSDIRTLWRFLGLHVVLSLQKKYQSELNNKGNTVLIFDSEVREADRFTDLIMAPPLWTESYYQKRNKDFPLDQIVDAPYFGDSAEVSLIQVADFAAYFLRRYIEINENVIPPRYKDEAEKVNGWIDKLMSRTIGNNYIYPKRSRCEAADLFYRYAPDCIKA